jgi:hypothetical protein
MFVAELRASGQDEHAFRGSTFERADGCIRADIPQAAIARSMHPSRTNSWRSTPTWAAVVEYFQTMTKGEMKAFLQ